jgi:predicted RNA polymerase sigma factor
VAPFRPGVGLYALQAAIAACHVRAPRSQDTDSERIVALYDALVEVAPSPVVALNRAVALSMAFGPEAGLEAVEVLAGEPVLSRYHLLPSVRGDLLLRLGRTDEARAEFERATALTATRRSAPCCSTGRPRPADQAQAASPRLQSWVKGRSGRSPDIPRKCHRRLEE